jgi:hypothetical protein
MRTEEILVDRFGPLITLSQLAGLLDRSPDGLRLTLSADTDLARALNPAKVKLGRRVYFRTTLVSQAIDAS